MIGFHSFNHSEQLDRITELPACPGDDASSSGGSSNTGAIVGGVVGGVAAVARKQMRVKAA